MRNLLTSSFSRIQYLQSTSLSVNPGARFAALSSFFIKSLIFLELPVASVVLASKEDYAF